jgi:predicted nucleic acid-binding protein
LQQRKDLAISLALESSDLDAATKMQGAFRLNLRAPDALHLVMAQRLNAMLATFEAKLAAAGKSVGVTVVP